MQPAALNDVTLPPRINSVVTSGDVDYVVSPCGYTLAPDGDTIRLYYGTADTSIALAAGSVGVILDWLEQRG